MKPVPPRSPIFGYCFITLIIGGVCVAVLSSGDTAPRTERAFTKAAMLDDLAGQVIVPAYSNFAMACRELVSASDALAANPNATTLDQAQSAWVEAMLAWRSAQVFRSGPLLDQDILSRIHFWPIRRQSVEKVLRDTRPINDAYVAEMGAPAVGLCAMEFLLFDLKGGDEMVLAAFTGSEAGRRKVYLRALAADLLRNATRVVTEWTKPGGYVEKFAASGQDSVNAVLNDMLQAVEVATEERLKYALDLQENGLLKPEFIQGSANGTSQTGVLEVLRGAQRIYSGGPGFGLDDSLRQIKSPLAGRAEAQFQSAADAVSAIRAPLEKALLKDRPVVAHAYDECKKLEILLKVEVVSALGVTLTFNSTDGD